MPCVMQTDNVEVAIDIMTTFYEYVLSFKITNIIINVAYWKVSTTSVLSTLHSSTGSEEDGRGPPSKG